ncbi:MAG TPA: Hsp33 family molecular chaperone HslO [Alphaproteobacteria bacterium]|nr:Hsp33 family molecular chaperone HslO [Alphaproteobacteria bacterium]
MDRSRASDGEDRPETQDASGAALAHAIGRHSARDDDLVQPFQIEGKGIRGRLVRLGPLVDDVLSRHDYPRAVKQLLGQTVALAATLAGAFKYEGVFTLQAKGDGAVNLLVADVTSAGEVRAYARYDDARLAQAEDQAERRGQGTVPRLVGTGYLAFTVDQGPDTERYQGIVELEGAELVDCVHHYFRQSEQLDAAFKLAVGEVADAAGVPRWRAAGMTLQRVPLEGGAAGTALEDGRRETQEDDWRRALVMMGSAKTEELLDPSLGAHDLLYRLFHEDGVRVFRQRRLKAGCRCSAERVETVLRALSDAEIAEMTVEGRVSVVCQFCMREYAYDEAAIAALRGG